jgi:hypothetical protein
MSSTLPIPPPAFDRTGVYARFGSIEDITPQFIRDNYLKGLVFVDDNGQPYGDDWYLQKVNVALSMFEHITQLTVTPRLVLGETHDYFVKDYQLYAFVQLFNYPLIVDQSYPLVKAIYPTGQLVTTFPREWVRADAQHGQIQLIPTQGTLSQVILGQGGSYLPIIYQGLGYLPQLFNVDYRAGFEKGTIPQIFIDAVAKLAVINIFSTIGESVYPTGVSSQSFGIDGMSQSRGYVKGGEFAPIFSGTINQYQRELLGDPRLGTPGLLHDIRNYYRGVNMTVTA